MRQKAANGKQNDYQMITRTKNKGIFGVLPDRWAGGRGEKKKS
jgi:hypothetical protein